MKRLYVLLALGGLLATIPAQIDQTREKVRRKVAAMRKAMREGKIKEYNVYVKVRLKNGNRLRGVVKNGRFVELHDGIDFVSASRVHDKGAGMRVWYTAGQKSYVFLRYEEIERYTIGSKLTEKQVKSIEHKLERQLADTRENYRRMREELRRKREGTSGGAVRGGTGRGVPDLSKLPKLTKAQEKLLKDFPAEDGWGKEKLDKLKRRRVTLGVFPNEKERRFEKLYDEWAKAYDKQAEIAKLTQEAEEKAAKEAKDKPTEDGEASGKTNGKTGDPAKPPK